MKNYFTRDIGTHAHLFRVTKDITFVSVQDNNFIIIAVLRELSINIDKGRFISKNTLTTVENRFKTVSDMGEQTFFFLSE